MGIAFSVIEKLDTLGAFKKGGALLDVGSSNLYGASEAGVSSFTEKYSGVKADTKVVSDIAAGSGYQQGLGGKNEAWAGQVFDLAGFSYLAFDIAEGYKTEVFDLNTQKLNPKLKSSFDLIINCGTTEHLIGQLNAFSTLHDATKTGGMLFHQLPHTGYSNHGYFTYTGRFFFDMAGHNKYEVVACWYDHAGDEPLTKCAEDYSTYFTALKQTIKTAPSVAIPTVSLNVLLRKTRDKPFIAGLETSTSVVR
ncbi:MAG: hypothetical protein AAFV45_09310 [Pseudomonadota bacterium]